MDNRIATEAQRQGLRGSLVRMPGRLVVGAWVVLFVASFGVAALVGWAEYQSTVVGRAQGRVDQLERSQYSPGNPFAQAAIDSALALEDRAGQAEARIVTASLAAALGWLLAFLFVTVGTWRWVTTMDGWVRVQSWHGGKLLMLYLPFMAVAALLTAAPAPFRYDDAQATIVVASALLLVACAAMLGRATWNWFTGRGSRRPPGSGRSRARPETGC